MEQDFKGGVCWDELDEICGNISSLGICWGEARFQRNKTVTIVMHIVHVSLSATHIHVHILPLRYLFCTFSSTSYSLSTYSIWHISSHEGAGCPSRKYWISADWRWERSGYNCFISPTFELWKASTLPRSSTWVRAFRMFSKVREGSNRIKKDSI